MDELNSVVDSDCERNISYSYEDGAECVHDDSGSDLGHILVVCLIYGPIVLVTILGNLLVIAGFFRDPTIRCQVANCYILSLACADLLMGLTMSLNFVWLLTDDWVLGKIPCLLLLCMDYIAAFASVLSIVLITYDRYRMVTARLKYLVVQPRRRAVLSICGCWTFCLIFYPALIVLWSPITGEYIIDYTYDCDLESRANLFANFLLIAIEFFLPLTILVYFNTMLYLHLRRRAKGLSRGELMTVSSSVSKGFAGRRLFADVSERAESSLSSVTVSIDGASTANSHVTASSPVNCSRSAFKRRRDFHRHRKAAVTLGLLVSVYVICWLPYYIMVITQTFCDDCINYYVTEVIENLLYCNSTINPFLYALLNRRYRRYFVNVFQKTHCMKQNA